MHPLRHAAARLGEPLDRHRRRRRAHRVEPAIARTRVGVERRRAQRRVGARPAARLGVLGGRRRTSTGSAASSRGELVERRQHAPRRRGRRRRAPAASVAAPPARAPAPPAPRPARPRPRRRAPRRGRDAPRRPARPPAASCRSRARPRPARAGRRRRARARQCSRSALQLRLAARQRRAGVELGRQLERAPPPGGSSDGSWRRIASCRRRSSGPGSTPIASTSAVARLAVGVERVGLPAAAVQRQHPLRVQPLAQRLLGDERLELADHLAVPARGQVVRRSPARAPPAAAPPAGGSPRPRTARRRRRPAAGRATAPAPRAARPRRPAARSAARRARRAEPQLVAAPARDDLRAVAARRQRLAQLRDVHLHHLGRRRRRLLAPQPVDQTLGRDRRALVEREHRQQRARLARADGDRPPVDAGLHGSQHAKVHATRRRLPRVTHRARAVTAKVDLPAFTGLPPPPYRRAQASPASSHRHSRRQRRPSSSRPATPTTPTDCRACVSCHAARTGLDHTFGGQVGRPSSASRLSDLPPPPEAPLRTPSHCRDPPAASAPQPSSPSACPCRRPPARSRRRRVQRRPTIRHRGPPPRSATPRGQAQVAAPATKVRPHPD